MNKYIKLMMKKKIARYEGERDTKERQKLKGKDIEKKEKYKGK
jgi:hypothetical protein